MKDVNPFFIPEYVVQAFAKSPHKRRADPMTVPNRKALERLVLDSHDGEALVLASNECLGFVE